VDVDGELCVTETNKALKSYAHKTLWSKNIWSLGKSVHELPSSLNISLWEDNVHI
jgi:hypothetical protein